MKLSKIEIIEKLNTGAILVEKFEPMYGKYYFLNDIDGNCIWNLNKKSIPSIIKMCNKLWIDEDTIEYKFIIN